MSEKLNSFFLMSALCLGLDFGYISKTNKTLRCITKCASVVNVIIFIVAAIDMPCQFSVNYEEKFKNIALIGDSLWYLAVFVQYLAYLYILNTSKYSLRDFLFDLCNIDLTMSVESKYISAVVYFYLYGISVIFSSISFISCFGYPKCSIYRYLIYIVYGIPLSALDAVVCDLFLVYYYVYRFVKLLKESLQSSELNLKNVQNKYIKLANCLDKIRPHYDMLLTIELLFDVPKIVVMLWELLQFAKMEMPILYYISENYYAFYMMTQLGLPALMVDLVKSETNSLKLLLHEQLSRERSQNAVCPECNAVLENEDVLRILRYLEARPLHRPLWSLIPTDLHLPIALYGLCFTYFIFTVQLTHVYD